MPAIVVLTSGSRCHSLDRGRGDGLDSYTARQAPYVVFGVRGSADVLHSHVTHAERCLHAWEVKS